MSIENNLSRLNIIVGDTYTTFHFIDLLNYSRSFFKKLTYDEELKTEFIGDFIGKNLRINGLNNLSINEINVYYDHNLFSLVPNSLYDDNYNKIYLENIFEIQNNDFIENDLITELEIRNVYVPYTNVNNLLIDSFNQINYFHYNSILLRKLSASTSEEKNKIFCIVNNKYFKVIIFQNSLLKMINHFKYETKEDILYFVLQSLKSQKIKAEKSKLNYIFNHKLLGLQDFTKEFIKEVNVLFHSDDKCCDYIFYK
ncbi:MAG: DUF3822 family protein [Bacteroidota bacterium]|nr:DUF3822 family protein [Bacteroidota bacterium]MEE2605352.1 DUF3822 family protein [Bacteroidota bacterium]